MHKKLHGVLFGISVLPALLVMPAMADAITERQVLNDDTVLDDVSASGIQNGSVGGVILSNRKLTIKNSEFSGNQSGAAAVLYDNSLTAYKAGETHSVTIEDSSFTGNQAGDFGAVAIFSPGSSVSNSTFSGNQATADYANLGDGAGALFLGSESQTIVSGSTFTNNSSGTIGGAVATRPINYWLDTNYSDKGTNSSVGGKVDILSSVFEQNHAGTRGGAFFNSFYNSDTKEGYAYVKSSTFNENDANFGGAIFIEGWTDASGGNAKLWIDESEFVDNTATTNGGAIYNESVLTVNGSTFTGNSAKKGGAIYNEGELTINNSSFTGNTATGNSGAIAQHDTAAKLTLNNVDFTNNEADWGGAMVVRGTATITGGSFTGNHSNDGGGAIYLATLANKGHKLSIDGTTFTGNFTAGVDVDGGGAIGSFSDLVLKNATFTGNHVDGTNSNGGGALFLGSVSTNDISNVTFKNNESATNGGAISMRYVTLGDNVDGTFDLVNGDFNGNMADGNGGAIYNTFHNDKSDNGYASVSNVTFAGNSAKNGGAVYNETFGTTDTVGGKMKLSDATFTNNTATTKGGAVYNAGELTFAGTNTFTNNKVNGKANDIYNVGTLNISGGTTTIDGGIDGTGTLSIANGATLNIGTASLTQNNITLNGTMLATLRSGDDAQINATTFDGNGTLKLTMSQVGTYHVFGDATFDNIAWDESGVTLDSPTYDLVWNGGDVTASQKSAEDIAEDNGLTDESGTAISGLMSSSSDTLNDLAVVIQEKLATGDAADRAEVEQATAAIHPEKESVVQSVTTSVQNTVVSLAANRMSVPAAGRNGGDTEFTGGGVWVEGLYNKSKMNGKFSGHTRGIAVGLDGTIDNDVTVGIGYSFNQSDVLLHSRDMDIDTNTVFLYGQYKPSEWYVNAVLNYTFSDYDEKGQALGTPVSADYKTNAFGGQVMTGYDFASGITPEIGLRYLHVNSVDYTNSLGIKNELKSTDYMTAMIGAKYGFDIMTDSWVLLHPELHGALKYDLLSDKSSATVAMPGVTAYTLDGDRLSRFGGDFGVGFAMKYQALDISLNYDIEVRKDYTSQTGRIKFRYEF